MGEEQDAINRGWQEKGDWLRQCLDLQLFNREADNIDAATGSHETFLEFSDLGVNFHFQFYTFLLFFLYYIYIYIFECITDPIINLMQSTLDDVEALLKRHDDFENTLIAQDERLKTFSEMARKLVEADYYDAKAINDRKKQVRLLLLSAEESLWIFTCANLHYLLLFR